MKPESISTNPINRQVCDPTTLLHWNHLGPGGVGPWRHCASERQRIVLARICGNWLERNGYESDRADDVVAETKPAGVDRFLPGFSFDLVVGRAVFLMRTATDLCPWVSRLVKRLLGIPKLDALAALAWKEGAACASQRSAALSRSQGLRGYSSRSRCAYSSARPSCLSWRNSLSI